MHSDLAHSGVTAVSLLMCPDKTRGRTHIPQIDDILWNIGDCIIFMKPELVFQLYYHTLPSDTATSVCASRAWGYLRLWFLLSSSHLAWYHVHDDGDQIRSTQTLGASYTPDMWTIWCYGHRHCSPSKHENACRNVSLISLSWGCIVSHVHYEKCFVGWLVCIWFV